MLAYHASRPIVAGRGSSPHGMLVIIGIHVAAIAVLMSARMDLPKPAIFEPTVIDFITEDNPPPPSVPEPRTAARPQPSLTLPQPLVPIPADNANPQPTPTPLPDFDRIIGPSVEPQPRVDPVPLPAPVRVGAQAITPASRLRPPYPASKLASGEEAVLRLRLRIDERGRVVAVEPVGPADGAFLAAARRHLIAHWRYRPATEGGTAVASSTVITLRFQLEG